MVDNNIKSSSNPNAATLTDMYTVTTGKDAVISSITVANRSATATSFRISVASKGTADNDTQYLYYDIPIAGNETFVATIGLALASTDVVRVYATLATLTFQLYGVEM